MAGGRGEPPAEGGGRGPAGSCGAAGFGMALLPSRVGPGRWDLGRFPADRWSRGSRQLFSRCLPL